MLSRLRRSISSAPEPLTEEEALTILQKELEDHDIAQTEEAKAFLTTACLQRYLRARNLSVPKAKDMLLASLTWRASYGPQSLYENHGSSLREEAASGKMFVLPPTHPNGSALIIMRPGLENSADPEKNIQYLVYTLERAANLTEDGKFIVIVDYLKGKVTASNMPSFSVSKQTVYILQNHYPERLRACILFDGPSFVVAMLKAIRPFIDPVTREKLIFAKSATAAQNEDCKRLLDLDKMPKEYGGLVDYEFDQESYFAQHQ